MRIQLSLGLIAMLYSLSGIYMNPAIACEKGKCPHMSKSCMHNGHKGACSKDGECAKECKCAHHSDEKTGGKPETDAPKT